MTKQDIENHYSEGWKKTEYLGSDIVFYRQDKLLHTVQYVELNAWKKMQWLDRYGELRETERQVIDRHFPANLCVSCKKEIEPYTDVYMNIMETNGEVHMKVFGMHSHICKSCASKHQDHQSKFFPEIVCRYDKWENNKEVEVHEYDDGSVVEGIVPRLSDKWLGNEN